MSSLPLEYSKRAQEDLRGMLKHLLPAVQEHLSRISANYTTCCRESAFPHPPGLESGLWVRHAIGVTLVEVLFWVEVLGGKIIIRRVLMTERDRLPDWVIRPDEWAAHPTWPVVDL